MSQNTEMSVRAGSAAYTGILLIVLASLFWSLNGALIKIVNKDGMGPGGVAIAFYRSLVGGVFLLPLAWGKWRTLRSDVPRGTHHGFRNLPAPAALWCVLFFTLMTACFVVANTKTAAANVIILQYTSTFWIFGLSPWILKEHPRSRDLWILLIAFGGIVIIFAGESLGQQPKPGNLVGLFCALSSGLFYGLLTMMIRKLRNADSAVVTVFNNLGSAVLLLPVVLWAGDIMISKRSLILLVFMGVVQFGVPYYLYALGLVRVPAYQAALITLIEPVLVPLWAYLAVRDPLPKYTLLGGGLILVALLVFLRAAGRNRQTPA